MSEKVAILGAGIAGLLTVLALAGEGREITLFERDPPPPGAGAEEAFAAWRRRGVGHLRHSHAFLARLRTLIGAMHPELLEGLRQAGAREIPFVAGLPGPLRAAYRPEPRDEELTVIVSRRTTMELVIRRHVESHAGVTLKTGVFVDGLVTGRDGAGRLTATGLRLQGGGEAAADIVIDAGGPFSPLAEWLAEAGAIVPEESETCAILYFTRFYRLAAGKDEPPRGPFPSTGDLGYLKFAIFPADAGVFSVTLAAPEVEEDLRAAVVRPAVFEAICRQLPGVAPWIEPGRSTALGKVHGMGNLSSRWREMAPRGAAAVLNCFSVGDSLVRTNPLYGRGCSFAAVQAQLLKDVLAQTPDPAMRATLYSRRVRAELRAFYDDMLAQDRAAARRALRERDANWRPNWRSRLTRSFARDGVAIAVRGDIELMRAASRAFHMLDPPRGWVGRPAVLAKVFAAWARGRRANAALYPPVAGPPRLAMLRALGLEDQDRRSTGRIAPAAARPKV